MSTAYFRFYEELNFFLPHEKRKKRFPHSFTGTPAVKDVIEALGIPHTEVDLILINGDSVSFESRLHDGDMVSVYPEFESFDISTLQKLRPEPLREPKFILDVHLGTLARYLRMLGFDTYYKNNIDDDTIVKIAAEEKRTILTRDRGLLKRSEVIRGAYIKNTKPAEQLIETVRRFDLKNKIREFTRCMACNGVLEPARLNEVEAKVPEKVKQFHTTYSYCPGCGKIYWEGSHYSRMLDIISSI